MQIYWQIFMHVTWPCAMCAAAAAPHRNLYSALELLALIHMRATTTATTMTYCKRIVARWRTTTTTTRGN